MKDNPVSCREVLEHICDNLDEGLNSPDCEKIKLHLNDCKDCTAYLKSLKMTISLYKTYPSPDPSETEKRYLEENILKHIMSDRK